MPDTTLPTLDLDSTLGRLKGDKHFLHMLFQVFLDDLPKKLTALNSAFESHDMEAILRSSHSLKGACATIGAEALRDAALTLETSSRQGDLHAARAAYEPVHSLAGELVVRLQKEIG